MAQTTTIILIPETAYSSGNVVIGDAVPAASYYLGNKNLQTLTWILSEVTANISIEATLAESPSDVDWFQVYSITANTLTQTNYHNIQGNFVWMRAIVNEFSNGVIQSIKISY
jgi:hypothetical protein